MPWVIENRKPVWKKNGNGNQDYFLFYHDSARWMVGRDYKVNRGYISTLYRNLKTVPVINWKYSAMGIWTNDDKLRVQAKGLAT